MAEYDIKQTQENLITVFRKLENLSGTNDKSKYAKSEVDGGNKLLELVLLNGVDKSKKTFMSKIDPTFYIQDTTVKADFNKFFEKLDELSKQTGAKNDDKREVVSYMGGNKDIQDILTRVVQKKLRININKKNIEKFIEMESWGVMLAKPQSDLDKFIDKNLGDTVIIQDKEDGMRLYTYVNKKRKLVTFFSRNGRQYNSINELKRYVLECVENIDSDEIYLDGEVIADNETTGLTCKEAFQDLQTMMTRKDGEGRIKKSDLRYMLFDIVIDKTQKERLDYLKDKIVTNSFVKILPYQLFELTKDKTIDKKDNIKNLHGLLDAVRDIALANNKEGLVIKTINNKYQHKKTIDWVKNKLFENIDVKVIGMTEGEGKYKGMIGSIIIMLSNKVTQSVSGFDDEFRKYYWEHQDELIGSYVEIKYQGYTSDKKLNFAQFERLRTDKNDN